MGVVIKTQLKGYLGCEDAFHIDYVEETEHKPTQVLNLQKQIYTDKWRVKEEVSYTNTNILCTVQYSFKDVTLG